MSSKAMPLYIHPDLRAKKTEPYLWFRPDTGEVGFSNGLKKKAAEEVCIVVPERLKATVVLQATATMKELVDKRIAERGNAALYTPEFLAEIKNKIADLNIQDNFARVASADEVLENVNIVRQWKTGQSAEEFCDELVNMSAQNGVHVDENDVKEALFIRIEELQRAGAELSTEQHEFLEEQESVMRVNNSPLRMKPRPGQE